MTKTNQPEAPTPVTWDEVRPAPLQASDVAPGVRAITRLYPSEHGPAGTLIVDLGGRLTLTLKGCTLPDGTLLWDVPGNTTPGAVTATTPDDADHHRRCATWGELTEWAVGLSAAWCDRVAGNLVDANIAARRHADAVARVDATREDLAAAMRAAAADGTTAYRLAKVTNRAQTTVAAMLRR